MDKTEKLNITSELHPNVKNLLTEMECGILKDSPKDVISYLKTFLINKSKKNLMQHVTVFYTLK